MTSISEFNKIKVPEEVQKIIQNSTGDFLETISVWLKQGLTKTVNTLTSLPTIGFYIVICILSLYFICTDKIYMLDQLEHHLPETWVKRLIKHIKEIAKALGCYLKAEAVLILISFIISLIGLYIFKIIGLNVQYPLMAALGIGFVDALPIFGSGTVMLPWALITACNGDFTLSLSILGLWALMSIVRQVIEPKVVSGQIGIHPIFTLIAMYTGFRAIGVLGMLVGPIILIILKNIFSTIIDKGIMKSIFDRE
ncbi:MAG TPA: AI-2E family transporter [Clostridiaceae bacterium]|nr:AI-2E family transporter [Clostridiaceae bacterium]